MSQKDKTTILAELGGIPEHVYDELVAAFVKQTAQQLADLRRMLAADERVPAAETLHSIKGCAANLRIENIFVMSADIEKRLKGGAASAAVLALLPSLETELKKVR